MRTVAPLLKAASVANDKWPKSSLRYNTGESTFPLKKPTCYGCASSVITSELTLETIASKTVSLEGDHNRPGMDTSSKGIQRWQCSPIYLLAVLRKPP